ncbi:MAG: terminase small subunit, partial [Acidobacteriales bacterium]|nr:terminase small subunit [Terriglobales bacterium]
VFVNQYLSHGNGARAVREAGYSPKSANSRAAQLLAEPRIQELIGQEESRALGAAELSHDQWLRQTSAIAFHDPRSFFRKDGGRKELSEMSAYERAALSISQRDEVSYQPGVGLTLTRRMRMKPLNKVTALDSLCRYLGPIVRQTSSRQRLHDFVTALHRGQNGPTRNGKGQRVDDDGLTHREAVFAQQYARHRNGARAARQAGYSRVGANSRAAQLMANPRVSAVIQRRQGEALSRVELLAGAVVLELQRIALLDGIEYYDYHGDRRPVRDLSIDMAAPLLLTFTETHRYGPGGRLIGCTLCQAWTVMDKSRALEIILKPKNAWLLDDDPKRDKGHLDELLYAVLNPVESPPAATAAA